MTHLPSFFTVVGFEIYGTHDLRVGLFQTTAAPRVTIDMLPLFAAGASLE